MYDSDLSSVVNLCLVKLLVLQHTRGYVCVHMYMCDTVMLWGAVEYFERLIIKSAKVHGETSRMLLFQEVSPMTTIL